ncbi:DUF1294 domain-containing protein [Salimicrobium sp. PL1-032A]|uniref:DUF1294 domain-containing protein n=1 Tax=Salimicrobium sp. PL1-032A TaxID=3095364 RepID=UPI003260CB73
MLWWMLAIMSVWTFIVMGWDKWKARRRASRVAEKTLFLLAVFGGAPGGVAGMFIFRHKTRKKKFLIVFPLFALIEIGAVLFFEWSMQ